MNESDGRVGLTPQKKRPIFFMGLLCGASHDQRSAFEPITSKNKRATCTVLRLRFHLVHFSQT